MLWALTEGKRPLCEGHAGTGLAQPALLPELEEANVVGVQRLGGRK